MRLLNSGAYPDGFEKLDAIERNLKQGSKDINALRRVLAELNAFSQASKLSHTSASVRARHASLQAICISNTVAIDRTGWNGHQPDRSLMYALDQFIMAEHLIGTLVNDEDIIVVPTYLEKLRETNAFEAAVAVTRLLVVGVRLVDLPVIPSTGCLSPQDQGKIKTAIEHRYELASRF